jgi:hypothetical protein
LTGIGPLFAQQADGPRFKLRRARFANCIFDSNGPLIFITSARIIKE